MMNDVSRFFFEKFFVAVTFKTNHGKLSSTRCLYELNVCVLNCTVITWHICELNSGKKKTHTGECDLFHMAGLV